VRTGAYRPGLGASWGREIAKSDRPRSGWVATPGGIQPSDRRHMRSEALCELPVVMAGGSCVQAEFEYRVLGIGHAGASWCGWFLYMMVWTFRDEGPVLSSMRRAFGGCLGTRRR
jgi:hypothetical protein